MIKERIKNLIEDAIVHMKIKPIDKDEMKYAKRKIDFAKNFIQDIEEMKNKSMEFSTITDLKTADIPEGTVVATKGFYTSCSTGGTGRSRFAACFRSSASLRRIRCQSLPCFRWR